MCVGATEQSSPTAEMQDSRLQTKDKNKHVEKYFKRPTLTNVRKYINEVKNTRCEFYVLLTVQLGSVLVNNQHDAQFFFFRICLFQFPTCFEHSCAHHQNNLLY